jgi:hypothetical protein
MPFPATKRRVTQFATAMARSVQGTLVVSYHGDPRSPYRTAVAVAERPRRTAHRIDTSRISRPSIVVGEAHLRDVLKVYASYYNAVRTHLSLDQGCIITTSGFSFSIGAATSPPTHSRLRHRVSVRPWTNSRPTTILVK